MSFGAILFYFYSLSLSTRLFCVSGDFLFLLGVKEKFIWSLVVKFNSWNSAKTFSGIKSRDLFKPVYVKGIPIFIDEVSCDSTW